MGEIKNITEANEIVSGVARWILLKIKMFYVLICYTQLVQIIHRTMTGTL